MDRQFELIKIASFYEELEKIASCDPELYQLLKEAGWLGNAARGIGGAARRVGGAYTHAGQTVGAKMNVLATPVSKGMGKLHHKAPITSKALHTGMEAGQEALQHGASLGAADVGSLLAHGVEIGGAGLAAGAAYHGARAAAPHVARAGRQAAQSVKSGIGRLRAPASPSYLPTGSLRPRMAA